MKHTVMPGTDLKFTPLALGTADFGSSISEEYSFRLIDRYVEGGGIWIDTARVYADWVPDGHGKSELTVGNWLKKSGLRNQVLISTKGAHPDLSTMNIARLAREDIISDVEESLKCLGVDTIDLYWLHRDDINRPVSDIIDSLNSLVKAGKIRYFGCSNWLPHRIQAALDYSTANGLHGFVSSQIQWSLADINEGTIADPTTVLMDKAGLDFYKKTSLPVFAFTSQAKGFFQKLHTGGIQSLKDPVKDSYYNVDNAARLKRVVEISKQLEISVSSVVLSYLISQPFLVVPVIGSSSIEQVEEALEVLEVSLSLEQVNYLEHG